MSFVERIVHSILFELGAIVIGMVVLLVMGQEDMGHSALLVVLLSLSAVIWSFIYNWIFDQFAKGDRLARTTMTRVIHAIGMEGGLLIVTVPLIAYMLDMDVWTAFLTDIAMTLVILVYTYIYNWIYDRLRVHFVG